MIIKDEHNFAKDNDDVKPSGDERIFIAGFSKFAIQFNKTYR